MLSVSLSLAPQLCFPDIWLGANDRAESTRKEEMVCRYNSREDAGDGPKCRATREESEFNVFIWLNEFERNITWLNKIVSYLPQKPCDEEKQQTLRVQIHNLQYDYVQIIQEATVCNYINGTPSGAHMSNHQEYTYMFFIYTTTHRLQELVIGLLDTY